MSFRPERSAVEKPASLPQPLHNHVSPQIRATRARPHHHKTVISTEGGALAAAVEKPASLPRPLHNQIHATREDQLPPSPRELLHPPYQIQLSLRRQKARFHRVRRQLPHLLQRKL